MTNKNRFSLSSPSWTLTATDFNGNEGYVENIVFISSTFEALRTIWDDTVSLNPVDPQIDLGGQYFAREHDGDWSAFSPPTHTGTASISNGTLSGSIKLASNGNVWVQDLTNFDEADNVWGISLDNVVGTMPGGYKDYRFKWNLTSGGLTSAEWDDQGGERFDVELNEIADTSRGFVFLTDPNRDFYNEQPMAAVWPPSPGYAMRYPITLQENWIPCISSNSPPVINGEIYTQAEFDYLGPTRTWTGVEDTSTDGARGSGTVVIGFLMTDEMQKTRMRDMVNELQGPAKGNPHRLTVCIRSGPNDIDDAQIKSWEEIASVTGGATDDIKIMFHRETIDIFLSGSGYMEFVLQGDRSFIKEPGQWVMERNVATNGEPYVEYNDLGRSWEATDPPVSDPAQLAQNVAKGSKSIYYKPAAGVPDAYYPVASDLLSNSQLQALDFTNVTFVGNGKPINGYSAGGVGYAIQHNNNYDSAYYYANNKTHNPDENWTNLYNCRLGYSYFGNRGMVNMYDCYSTDCMKIAQGVADGSINLRSVFCGAWQREEIIVLGNVGSGAAADISCRRSIVRDCLFYNAMTNHGQGVSFYADANLNCEMEHCLFLDCQRSFSTQPNARRFTANNGGAGDDGCIIFNNLSVMDAPLDVYSPPGQAAWANNGGSDYWVNQDWQYICENNTIVINPDLFSEYYYPTNPLANPQIEPQDLMIRMGMDMGELFFCRPTVRNNVYGYFRTRKDSVVNDFQVIADISAAPATPKKDERILLQDHLTANMPHPARMWDTKWGWIPIRARMIVDDLAELGVLAASWKSDDNNDPAAVPYETITGYSSFYLEDLDIVLVSTTGDDGDCYAWRQIDPDGEGLINMHWVQVDDPYVDRTLNYVDANNTGRKEVKMAGNLSLAGFVPDLHSIQDIGKNGDYTEATSTFDEIVYVNDEPIRLAPKFNDAGAESITPGVMWTTTPSPDWLRAAKSSNFKNVVSTSLEPGSSPWYEQFPAGNPVDIAAIKDSRLNVQQWDDEFIAEPADFAQIVGTSGSEDKRLNVGFVPPQENI